MPGNMFHITLTALFLYYIQECDNTEQWILGNGVVTPVSPTRDHDSIHVCVTSSQLPPYLSVNSSRLRILAMLLILGAGNTLE